MAGKSLEILISAKIPAIGDVNKLVQEYDALIQRLMRVQELSRGTTALASPKQGPGTTEKSVKNIKDVTKAVGEAKKATVSWTRQWLTLQGVYNKAIDVGAMKSAEGVLKDMQGVLDKRGKTLSKMGKDVD